MAIRAQGDQILFTGVAEPAHGLDVMDPQVTASSAGLAAPPVTLQDLLAQLLIGLGLKALSPPCRDCWARTLFACGVVGLARPSSFLTRNSKRARRVCLPPARALVPWLRFVKNPQVAQSGLPAILLVRLLLPPALSASCPSFFHP